MELTEETLLLVAEYLATHKPLPVRGAGTVRLEFQASPVTRVPALEPLLHDVDGHAWFIRWPNGQLRWVTEQFLRAKGFEVPHTALVQELA